MSNSENKLNRKYAYLERLSVEKLEELLRRAGASSWGQDAFGYYEAIETAILQKEQQTPSGRLSDVDLSWKEFLKHYATPESDGMRLYSEPETDDGERTPSSHTPRFALCRNKIFRKVALVAAVAAVLFASMIAAQAAGLDIFGRFAQWTNEIFYYDAQDVVTPASRGEEYSVQSNEIHNAIQAEVEKCGISAQVGPVDKVSLNRQRHDIIEKKR